jgi:hypothetical protein
MADDAPVWFTEWATVLDGEPLDKVTRERYRRSVVGYLHHLKMQRLRATVSTAKAYVEDGEAKGMTLERAVQ